MLGRLEMDVDECIAKFDSTCERIFKNRSYASGSKRSWKFTSRKRGIEPNIAFDHNILEECIKDIVHERGSVDAENELLNDGKKRKCKV